MPNQKMPPLGPEALERLREVVRNVGTRPRAGIPMAEVLTLPASLSGGMAVTVDFGASRELGHEIIVLRVPAPAGRSEAHPRLANLSRRESEIASLIASGLSNKQIAARTFLSLATIKSHVHHILAKTGLPNRAAIAAAVAGHS
jgi:DNA-binding CsgD family transcriptional regulator